VRNVFPARRPPALPAAIPRVLSVSCDALLSRCQMLITAHRNWDKPPDMGNILAGYAKRARLDVSTIRFVHETVEKVSDCFAITGTV
jgi:hypothetical protein